MDESASFPGSKFRQAAEHLRAGRKREARQLLREVLITDNENLVAWEMLTQATYTKDEEIYCLRRILGLDPRHPWAQQRLDSLSASLPAAGEAIPPPNPQTTTGTFSILSSLPNPPAGPVPLGVATPPEPPPARKKKRDLTPVYFASGLLGLLCLGLWVLVLLRAGLFPASESQQATQTAAARRYADCQSLIDQAMQIAGNDCDQTGPNTVCYGNLTLQAQLIPGSQERFAQRGDVINIGSLLRLSASPLNLDNAEWGIAIFKMLANLPRSLPGELVTMVVFGNTTLDNPNQDLQSFYFSSQLGQIVCEQVPFDGIMISMPEGVGVHFLINGTDLTLSGTASLRAAANQVMQVNLYDGSALVAVGDDEQFVGAGQGVLVPLGGDNGTSPTGGPSAPIPLSQDELDVACNLTGQYCTSDQIEPVDPGQAQTDIQSALGTPSATPSVAVSPTSLPSSTLAGTPTRTLTATRTPSPSRTPTITRTPSRTLSPTFGPSPTASRTPTRTVSPTASFTPTHSYTPSATRTPSRTATETVTAAADTPTHTPSRTPTATVAIVCSPNGFSLNGKDIEMGIQNSNAVPMVIESIHIVWVGEADGQILHKVVLGTKNLWDGNDQNSPSDLPGELVWTTSVGNRTIPAGGSLVLKMEFQKDLAASGYSVDVTFVGGCTISGSQ